MKTIIQICLALITLSITSCSNNEPHCPPDKTYNRFLRDSTLLQIPFTGTDTLIYVSNYNDTATLFGQGYDRAVVPEKQALSVGNSDCMSYAIYNAEYLKLVFKGNNPNFSYFEFLVGYSSIYDLYEREWITITHPNKSILRGLVIGFNDTSYYKYQLTIKNKIYYGYAPPRPTLVYNKKIGFLKFKPNDTLIYTLNNIKE